MLEMRTCHQCGKQTATSLACAYCGYQFQTDEGEVEIGLLGTVRRPVRINLRALLVTGGIVVLTMCICPQPLLYIGTIIDQGLGIRSGFWSMSNATAAALIACPVIYGIGLAITLLLIWRRQKRS